MFTGKERRMTFKLTYATMFDPPEALHTAYDQALEKLRKNLGQEYGMIINGEDRFAAQKFESTNPADASQVLGVFQSGTAQDAEKAIAAAKAAFPSWSRTSYQERVSLLRAAAALIDERVYEIAAAISLEVGKNRLEALGDIAETADLLRYACDQMEANNGFVVRLDSDPLAGYRVSNFSMLKPYGVWLVISPFNFPTALSGGPVGAALVTGNTVVLKPATDTPWTVRLLVESFRDAGLPDGVLNFVTGSGRTLGRALVEHPDVDGITFTGSYDVGMEIYRGFGKEKYVRPAILELGGKNPVIVSRNADLERAALGITRSAFGLQGQKCSAASRIYIESPAYDELVDRLAVSAAALKIGDPTRRDVYLGPVINRKAYQDYKSFAEELSEAGNILTGGKTLNHDLKNGYFCQPTIAADVPESHRLWKQEMFLPITMVHKVENLDQAMRLANNVDYGLTAGFYGSKEETEWFFDHIQAGVNYANRPHGATTGAWPGFQPFGGWKGSGSSGKNAGGYYYLQLYMHEQIQTRVE
jgi:1-pyrroline-5-carboxylate dehydrogenase